MSPESPQAPEDNEEEDFKILSSDNLLIVGRADDEFSSIEVHGELKWEILYVGVFQNKSLNIGHIGMDHFESLTFWGAKILQLREY